MTRPINYSPDGEPTYKMPRRHRDEPIYGKAWKTLKRFPQGLAAGSDRPPTVSGPAAAAFLSAAIGCFTMMVAHHLGDTSKARDAFLLQLGNWIPGATNPDPMWGNIGSYTGKETMLLIGWLVSWPILYALLKHKQVQARTIFFWMFALIAAATAMSWHPLFPYMPLI
jgi:hypothetical protein